MEFSDVSIGENQETGETLIHLEFKISTEDGLSIEKTKTGFLSFMGINDLELIETGNSNSPRAEAVLGRVAQHVSDLIEEKEGNFQLSNIGKLEVLPDILRQHLSLKFNEDLLPTVETTDQLLMWLHAQGIHNSIQSELRASHNRLD